MQAINQTNTSESVEPQKDVVAIIDIGSNSGRVVVFEHDAPGHLRQLVNSRASLRLIDDVDKRGEFSEQTMARVTDAVRDFKALAVGAGAGRIVAIATEAMRDARNGPVFAERLRRELGIRIDVISGGAEARHGFAGAVRGLAVSKGLLFDLGGGSMELTTFARRQRGHDVSLPLGALRLSTSFLDSDPPTRTQLKRLRDHIRSHLTKAALTRLTRGDVLVGTGGTLRNLAKVDAEAQRYPINSLHAYELPLDRLAEIVGRLAGMKEKHRDDLPGLSADRADSIVGGAVAIHTLAEFVGATHITVSAQGIREGLALGLLGIRMSSPDTVKQAALASLMGRFGGWTRDAAMRRVSLAATLYKSLGNSNNEKGRASRDEVVLSSLRYAADILDIGRARDVVQRHEQVADILLTTELIGFTHTELALMAAVLRRAGDRHADIRSLAAIGTVGPNVVERAAIILALADEIEARCPRGRPIPVRIAVDRTVTLTIPVLPSWLERDLEKRFERAFGRALLVRH